MMEEMGLGMRHTLAQAVIDMALSGNPMPLGELAGQLTVRLGRTISAEMLRYVMGEEVTDDFRVEEDPNKLLGPVVQVGGDVN